jgi:hypothetical protein
MQEIVAALGFRKVGQITLKESTTHPRFVLDGEFNGRGAQDHAHGWVYLWIAIDRQSSFNVRYVGKAGKSLKARCTQHEGGFKGGSTKGVRHAEYLREFLTKGDDRQVLVFARKSPEATILDEPLVSFCEAEERAMLMKMRRLGAKLWNSP